MSAQRPLGTHTRVLTLAAAHRSSLGNAFNVHTHSPILQLCARRRWVRHILPLHVQACARAVATAAGRVTLAIGPTSTHRCAQSAISGIPGEPGAASTPPTGALVQSALPRWRLCCFDLRARPTPTPDTPLVWRPGSRRAVDVAYASRLSRPRVDNSEVDSTRARDPFLRRLSRRPPTASPADIDPTAGHVRFQPRGCLLELIQGLVECTSMQRRVAFPVQTKVGRAAAAHDQRMSDADADSDCSAARRRTPDLHSLPAQAAQILV
ncbi:hypothetical protein EXIGLDRAFT_33613 [Exidia glandulosa HHB12029]|uniref:Uncharacterized protein n=1 Tax=Exidia glandulosa HHB12029 TaxID=1314781 RepID=A0A165ITE7_EXIGL|nr:hypothetical protein EXIGLDRAFT_33613 [Exidia glandulosa HHB12029]